MAKKTPAVPTPAAEPVPAFDPASGTIGIDLADGESFSTTVVHGAVFRVDPSEVLAAREYEDRVVVVTIDGRKLVEPKVEPQ